MKVSRLAFAAVALVASAARSQSLDTISAPDFSDSAGEWDIEGFVVGKGNTIICKMRRPASNGSQSADFFMLSAGSDGMTVADAYVTSTTLPEGSSPKVSLYFDGRKAIELTGGVKKGFLHADIAKLEPLQMARITKLFTNSASLAEVAYLKGHPLEKVTVDLTDSEDAFDKRGRCSKEVMDVGMARMDNSH